MRGLQLLDLRGLFYDINELQMEINKVKLRMITEGTFGVCM